MVACHDFADGGLLVAASSVCCARMAPRGADVRLRSRRPAPRADRSAPERERWFPAGGRPEAGARVSGVPCGGGNRGDGDRGSSRRPANRGMVGWSGVVRSALRRALDARGRASSVPGSKEGASESPDRSPSASRQQLRSARPPAPSLRQAEGRRSFAGTSPEARLDRFAAFVIPGGFSYQDRIRAGAVAARLPSFSIVARRAARGGAGSRDLQRRAGPRRGGIGPRMEEGSSRSSSRRTACRGGTATTRGGSSWGGAAASRCLFTKTSAMRLRRCRWRTARDAS